MNFTRINTSGIPDDVLFLINVIVFAVIILCTALVAVTHLVDKAKERQRPRNYPRDPSSEEQEKGRGQRQTKTGGRMDHRFKGWTTGWVHPTVKRGTFYWTAQAIVFAGAAVLFIFLALLNPTVERLWWAGLAGIAGVLAWFLSRKMIRDLQYEFRYEEDDNATGQGDADA
jgi:Flp pilus assembly protein TadB